MRVFSHLHWHSPWHKALTIPTWRTAAARPFSDQELQRVELRPAIEVENISKSQQNVTMIHHVHE